MKMNRFRDFPFLIVGLGSFLIFFVMLLLDPAPGSRVFQILVVAWQVVGFGPHTMANLLAQLAPGIPPWLDAALVVALGLLPYLVADFLLAHYRRRLSHSM